MSRFFEKEGLSRKMVVGCTTDGASSMLGCRSGFVARVSKANVEIKKHHSMIYRYALCTKTLPPGLKFVVLDVVAMVNFVKSNPLNTSTQILRLICQQLNSIVETLLLHTELRWVSKGKVIARVATLKTETKEFFV